MFMGEMKMVNDTIDYSTAEIIADEFGAKVTKLERIAMGNFYLPKDLKVGECREFTLEELKKIQEM